MNYKRNILNIIYEVYNKILFEEKDKFNLHYFENKLHSSERIKYAKKFLPKIGKGFAKTVFRFDDNKVLKISNFGHDDEQIRDEIDFYNNTKVPKELLTKVYFYPKDELDRTWVISEYVKPVYDNMFTIDNKFLNYYHDMMSEYYWDDLGFDKIIEKTINRYNLRFNNSKITKFSNLDLELLKKIYILYENGLRDIFKYDNWGITFDNKLVLIDYGF